MPNNIYSRIEKSSNEPIACIGNEIIYTIEIENIATTYPLTDITFTDMIPDGLSFKQGSVEIDGDSYPDVDPSQGIELQDDLNPADIVEIKFIAEATHVPSNNNPTVNIANIRFNTFDESNDPVEDETEYSNSVEVTIRDCQCDEGSCERSVCKIYTVSLPFTVKPFARKETPDIDCYDEMTLTDGHQPCPDPQQDFDYTLTQQVRVELPVTFGAEVCYEEPCAVDNGECDADDA